MSFFVSRRDRALPNFKVSLNGQRRVCFDAKDGVDQRARYWDTCVVAMMPQECTPMTTRHPRRHKIRYLATFMQEQVLVSFPEQEFTSPDFMEGVKLLHRELTDS